MMQRRENYKRSPSKLKTVGNLRFKPVTVLDLRGCGSVTDDNVETITTVFKQLTVLRIGNNPTISDKSMKSIALNSKLLEILDIRFVSTCQDILLSFYLFYLLSRSSCLSVTDAGLFTVTKHCTNLMQVDIEEAHFTPEILNLLEEKKIRINSNL